MSLKWLCKKLQNPPKAQKLQKPPKAQKPVKPQKPKMAQTFKRSKSLKRLKRRNVCRYSITVFNFDTSAVLKVNERKIN